MNLQVWLDGRLVPAAEAVVSVFDRGFRNGEGVFETFRAYGDHVFRLEQHLDRAVAGADELGFSPGHRTDLHHAVAATARANLAALGGRDSALRLTVSAGPIDPDTPFPGRAIDRPTVVVTSHALADDPHREGGWRAATVPLARELPHVKAVSYLVAVTARRRARDRGAQEALLTSPDGTEVLEGAGSNLFAVVDGTLVTPPTSAGLLAGVTRAVVIEVAGALGLPVETRPLSVATLTAADEAFLTATTREVVPLVAVDGRPVGSGQPGPVTARLLSGYRDLVERERITAAAGD